MKRIIWSRFPFATFKTHYFSFDTPVASRCEWLTKIFWQVKNIIMSKSSRLCFLNGYSIEPNFIIIQIASTNFIVDTRLECDTRFELQQVGKLHFTLKIMVSVVVLSFSTFKNLQMTLTTRIITKTEKYFLNIKLISVASTQIKVEFQASNSFDIASIYPAYLNTSHKL